jgi:monovalent cation:H+ antiporter-2, CPA2 family
MTIDAVLVVEDLAIVLLVALAVALIFYRLGQPLLVGYVIAGIIIGPYTPPFGLLHYPDVVEALAQIGIAFLLFAVGLEYPLARLRQVGRASVVIATAESLATFAAGYALGTAFGFSVFDSLFLGLAIAVTSTVILSQALEDLGLLHRGETRLILGITVVEDLITVSLLSVLQETAVSGHLALPEVALALGLVGLFIGGTLLIGSRTVPVLVDRLAALRRPELLLLGVLGLALGLAYVSSALGVSIASGAFFAGVLVAESKSQAAAKELIAPFKQVFGAIFFVSMGALMDLRLLPAYALEIAAFLGVAISVKFVATYLAARQQRVEPREARLAAINLSASGGELSLVVAKGGEDVGAVGAFVLPFVGALTIVTTFLSPYLVRWAWRAADRDPAVPPAPTPSPEP